MNPLKSLLTRRAGRRQDHLPQARHRDQQGGHGAGLREGAADPAHGREEVALPDVEEALSGAGAGDDGPRRLRLARAAGAPRVRIAIG